MTQDALLSAPEPIQLSLPLAREEPGAVQGARAIKANFSIPEVGHQTRLESLLGTLSGA